jgi:protein KRI1
MARTKASKGKKRELNEDSTSHVEQKVRPSKKTKLLGDSDDEADEDAGGIALKINEEYARRFDHNKKREEKHRRKRRIHYEYTCTNPP